MNTKKKLFRLFYAKQKILINKAFNYKKNYITIKNT